VSSLPAGLFDIAVVFMARIRISGYNFIFVWFLCVNQRRLLEQAGDYLKKAHFIGSKG
jgi:hypothetical protein